MDTALILPLTVATPLAGAGFILLAHRYGWLREAVTLVSAVILTGLVLLLLPDALDGRQTAVTFAQPVAGIALSLQVEPLGVLFALLASCLWIVTAVYSIGYMRAQKARHQTRFYASFALSLACTMGIAFSANMFTLYVFYEALTLSTYPLVTHTGTDRACRAGRIYLGVLLSTSIGLLLLAMIWTWSLAGTLDFRPEGILAETTTGPMAGALYVLYLFGIAKAAIMPFHFWLPAAMVAPAPVSALLHAVAVVKAGVFTILKVTVYLFGIDRVSNLAASDWLMYLAAFTILAASIIALYQDDLKTRLAYSTVSHLSYVILGALLANAAGIVGAALHMVTHGFAKITLFFCAGAVIVTTGKTAISQMDGLGLRMPITMTAFFVASLSLIGLPPLGGMWSKWYLVMGALQAQHLLMLGVLLIGSLLNVAYLLPISARAFFRKPAPEEQAAGIREAPTPSLVAIIVTTIGCLALFFFADPLYQLVSLILDPATDASARNPIH